MWLIIRDEDGAVVGTNYGQVAPNAPLGHTIKEWSRAEPAVHNPEAGVESYDPTLADPDYPIFVQARVDLDALADKAATEIAWLEETIPAIDGMTLEELRSVLKRVARENAETLRAWRYVIRRLK